MVMAPAMESQIQAGSSAAKARLRSMDSTAGTSGTCRQQERRLGVNIQYQRSIWARFGFDLGYGFDAAVIADQLLILGF